MPGFERLSQAISSWSSQICSASFQFSRPPHRYFCWERAYHIYLGIQTCWIQASFQFSSQALSSIDYIPLLLIIFPTLYSSVSQRNLPPYGLYFMGWGAEQRNIFIATMELGLQDGMWHVLFQQEFIFPLLWSRRHPPFYLLNKAMSVSVWEICPVAQLQINKCSKQMGGTIPKCRVVLVGAPWLLRDVGLWGTGCDGLSLVFQATSTCSSKNLNLCAVSSLKCGESQSLDV